MTQEEKDKCKDWTGPKRNLFISLDAADREIFEAMTDKQKYECFALAESQRMAYVKLGEDRDTYFQQKDNEREACCKMSIKRIK